MSTKTTMTSRRSYASIYTLDGGELTTGLKTSSVCDEAIDAAQAYADARGEDVHLIDDDGEWIVHPMRSGKREAADPK